MNTVQCSDELDEGKGKDEMKGKWKMASSISDLNDWVNDGNTIWDKQKTKNSFREEDSFRFAVPLVEHPGEDALTEQLHTRVRPRSQDLEVLSF